LVRVSVRLLEPPIATLPKVSGLGENTKAPEKAVPARAAVALPMARVAVLAPAVWGMKTRMTVQLAPAASEVPQVPPVTNANSEASAPLNMADGTVTVVALALLKVRVTLEMVLTPTPPKFTELGVRTRSSPVPLTVTELPPIVTRTDLAPLAVGVKVTTRVQYADGGSTAGQVPAESSKSV
jgi:hypothetical protein